MLSKIILSILIVSPTILFAQKLEFKGKISSNQNKNAVEGVSVIINNHIKGYSDFKGNFKVSEINTEPTEIVLTSLGYETKILNFQVNNYKKDTTIDFGNIFLEETTIKIPEVNVISNAPVYQNKTITTLNTITKKELELMQPIGSEEALKKLPGVNVSGDMGISNRLNIGIRGSYPRRSEKLLVLEDGRPIAPAPYLAPEMYYNPPADRLDGIEIIKGADILTYGANTMYGVVNYITKLPPLKPTLSVNLSGGENGYQSQYVTYGGTWNKTGAELQVLNKQFDGFQDNSGSKIFNTTFKTYSELNKNQSIYVKANFHQENSKASYSALTPLTFNLDPTQNPFDADDLHTKRYAFDFGFNQKIGENILLSTKAYASQFIRNWWRQENTLIKAKDAKTYLGEDIFNERYSYLNGLTFTDDDYVRVGIVTKGKEKTRARNRTFLVGGIEQLVKWSWKTNSVSGKLEAGIKYHAEQFNDVELTNDSSRFARSGKLVKDNQFNLQAQSGFIKHAFLFNKLTITPTIRYESINMYRYDLLSIAQNSKNDGSKRFGASKNTFTTTLGGIALAYSLIDFEKNKLNLYGGVYQGYTPPTSGYGFLNVTDDVVNTAPKPEDPINIKPETSLNFELGSRYQLFNSFVTGQSSYFNNNIKNFYSAGRNEAFQTLGNVNINGVEAGVNLNLHQLVNLNHHEITVSTNLTYMDSKILSGTIVDSDLLKAKHTTTTKEEIVNKINNERNGYNVYITSTTGKDSLINREVTIDDFSKIKKLEMIFGENGIKDNQAPYIPKTILNIALNYGYKGFNIGGSINYVDKQYVDYINLNNQTAEGAMGAISAYKNIDANLSYSFSSFSNKWIKGLTICLTGKNLTNQVYLASRLHRLSSGMMPGGFRQLNAGIKWNF